jgi:hypothetical protein
MQRSDVSIASPKILHAGEAIVVAQAASLLLWDVCLLGLSFLASLGSPGSLGLGSIIRRRSDVALFVELLVFGALAAALPCVVLLRTLCPQPASGSGVVSRNQAKLHAVPQMLILVCINAAHVHPVFHDTRPHPV